MKFPAVVFLLCSSWAAAAPELIRSVADGPWSAAATWEKGEIPAAGDRVLIRSGHEVVYDVVSEDPIRAIQIAGILRFATDRDTRLDVGLIRIEAGDEWKEEAPHCHLMPPEPVGGEVLPALEIGLPQRPVAAGHRALIRLVPFEGDDPDCLPGIVCVAGRMDLHGAPMDRTWVKLGRAATPGENRLFLAEAVRGWNVGDRVIVTATNRQRPFAGNVTEHITERPLTEERTISSFAADTMAPRGMAPQELLILDQRLDYHHAAADGMAAEVANLSRNVVIESAEPDGIRGHTMYHRYSKGSISYVEFRHLGKEGHLGRYPVHYHLTGDSMRGSSIVGASVWGSDNRWVTLHGTSHLIVRDCVGYGSVGHGFFLENGEEVYNVLDRNLAVHALVGKPLPDQALSYDRNDGAGFWWANSRNVFTRNVAVECDQHGFRFEVEKTADFDPVIDVPQPDGSRAKEDLRKIPFLRFDDNEAHAQRRFAVNLGGIRGMVFGPGGHQPESIGGDVDGIGPDSSHPFIVRNLKVWDSHWSFHAGVPSVLCVDMELMDGQYGIWRSVMSGHEYRGLKLGRFDSSPLYFPMGAPDEEEIHLEGDLPTFPQLMPVDDLPPASVITRIEKKGSLLVVHGESIDHGEVVKVTVNGVDAVPAGPAFSTWMATVPLAGTVEARSTDAAGNRELRPHVVAFSADGEDAGREVIRSRP